MSATVIIATSGALAAARERDKRKCDDEVMPGFSHHSANAERRQAYAACVERFYAPTQENNPHSMVWVLGIVLVIFIVCFAIVANSR